MRQNRPQRPPLHRLAVKLGAGAVALAALYSCSLIVESGDVQCTADADCVSFTGATCDKQKGVCVGGTGGGSSTSTTTSDTSTSSSTTSSTGTGPTCDVDSGTSDPACCDIDGGVAGGGCWACIAKDDSQLLNKCVDGCIPFDNKRVTLLPDGGKLPPIP